MDELTHGRFAFYSRRVKQLDLVANGFTNDHGTSATWQVGQAALFPTLRALKRDA
jgi:hypothetical protein